MGIVRSHKRSRVRCAGKVRGQGENNQTRKLRSCRAGKESTKRRQCNAAQGELCDVRRKSDAMNAERTERSRRVGVVKGGGSDGWGDEAD